MTEQERSNGGLVAPAAKWATSWTMLTGYVQQARDDGEQIDPVELLTLMAEYKTLALAPLRAWLTGSKETGE